MSKPHLVRPAHYRAIALSPIRSRSSLPWRLAAIVAVAAQIVTSICGVLLLFYWIAASIALIE